MSLFSGTPKPDEVFTPRSADVNRRYYIPRPELEEELKEGLTESQHLIIFGESGNGKSWLYKSVFDSEDVTYEVVNLVQASRLGSLGAAFEDRLARREELEKNEYELAKSGGVKPSGVGVEIEGTWKYVKGKKESFERLLAYLRRKAGKGKAVIVLDNFEQIASDPEICKQVSNCIVLLDDPTYAEYNIKIVIVGTPAGIDETLSKSGNLQTISTRLKEIPEVERMTPNEAKTLMHLGLETALKLKVIGNSEVFYERMLKVTDRIALELQELGLRIAKEAQKKNGKIDQVVFDRATTKWAKNSIRSYCAMLADRLNSSETKAARRNQCLYACGEITKDTFTYKDIEEKIRELFPETTENVTLNVSGELSKLSKDENPLLRRIERQRAYRLSSPKVRMAIRTMLAIKDGRVVRIINDI
jgi:hypothetical protein